MFGYIQQIIVAYIEEMQYKSCHEKILPSDDHQLIIFLPAGPERT